VKITKLNINLNISILILRLSRINQQKQGKMGGAQEIRREKEKRTTEVIYLGRERRKRKK
jgi:hypothetical protein